MGSSVRKTSAKIKKLLKETIDLNPSTECKEVIPQLAEQTLRSKKTKGYFGDKDFVVLAGGGFSCFKKVSEIGFIQFIQEYEIKDEKLTIVDAQKIVESILDRIEDENGEIDSMIILSAFQCAMTKMLMNKLVDPSEFLSLFCEIFITMVIRENVNEDLTNAFKDTSADTFNKNIEEFSLRYVKSHFDDLIKKCSSGEIEIEELIKAMQNKLGKSKE